MTLAYQIWGPLICSYFAKFYFILLLWFKSTVSSGHNNKIKIVSHVFPHVWKQNKSFLSFYIPTTDFWKWFSCWSFSSSITLFTIYRKPPKTKTALRFSFKKNKAKLFNLIDCHKAGTARHFGPAIVMSCPSICEIKVYSIVSNDLETRCVYTSRYSTFIFSHLFIVSELPKLFLLVEQADTHLVK